MSLCKLTNMRWFFAIALVAASSTCGSDAFEDTFNYAASNFTVDSYGPPDWSLVTCNNVETCPGWPTNWEVFNPFIPYDETKNQCKDCADSNLLGICRGHKQSPIPLYRNVTAERQCIDRHRMNYIPGNCKFGHMKFEILPHVLRAYQPESCDVMPNIDFSQGFPVPWLLRFTDISVPSQHTLEGIRYDAEVVLSHTYSENHPNKLIANVAILLERGTKDDNYDFLDLYLREWVKEEKRVKNSCARRKLNSKKFSPPRIRRRLSEEMKQESEQPVEEVYYDDDDYVDDEWGVGEDEDEDEDLEWDMRNLQLQQATPQKLAKPWFDRQWQPYDWYVKTGTEFYFRYEGSAVEPPCMEAVHWRVLKDPVKVAPSQMTRLERLIADRIDPETCEPYTAGRPRGIAATKVSVNRPLQTRAPEHKLVFCECVNWNTRSLKDRQWCQLSMEERGVFNVSTAE